MSMPDSSRDTGDRGAFLAALRRAFPEAYSSIDENQEGLLHCEVGAFRVTVEKACHSGKAWYVERAMHFVEQQLLSADPELLNALEISFIEDFTLGSFTQEARKIVVTRTPSSILAEIRKVAKLRSKIPDFWD